MKRAKHRNATLKQGSSRLGRAQLFLALAATDHTYTAALMGGAGQGRQVWQGKCIHCQAGLWLEATGKPCATATLEHITPQSLGGDDSWANLAIACARCNQQKGTRLDVLGLHHPRLQAVIARLETRKQSRRRQPPDDFRLSADALQWCAG